MATLDSRISDAIGTVAAMSTAGEDVGWESN
jgi:hypothetical protein